MQPIDPEALVWASGGDDETGGVASEAPADTGGGDVHNSSSEPQQNFDTSQNEMETLNQAYTGSSPDAGSFESAGTPTSAQVDPATGIPLPEYPTEAPYIPPATPEEMAQGPSAGERFNTQVDIAQNYRDVASPGEVFQTNAREDCFNVAAINALNQYDPEGMASLVTPTRNPDVMQVHTVGRNGQDDTTYVNPWPLQPKGDARYEEPEYSATGHNLNGAGISTDPNLQSIYNATTQRYHPNRPGYIDDAMERLGATGTVSDDPTEIAERYRNGEGGGVLGTYGEEQLSPEDQEAYARYNLQPGHAYTIASIIRNEEDGRDYAVVTNPYYPNADGSPRHPVPIPVDELPRFFSSGAVGRFRNR